MLSNEEIESYKTDGAIVLRKKFDINWIEKLKTGIKKDIKNPSPRFKSHTIEKISQLIWKIIGHGIEFQSLKILCSTLLFPK